MTGFLLELYVARTNCAAGGMSADRFKRAALEVTAEGKPVRLLRSIFVPEDETCFLLFDAASADLVAEAVHRAGLRHEHISAATSTTVAAASAAATHPKGTTMTITTQLTDYTEPVRNGMWWPAKPDVLVFARDVGGNEQRQIYRLDAGSKEPVLLTDSARANAPAAVNRARTRLLVTSTDVDKVSGRRDNPTLDLALVDPLAPDKKSKIATLPGTAWGDFSFSFDDRRLALVEFKSITESYVWVMDLKTGERRRVLPATGPATGHTIASSEVNFSRDGKGLFLTTDRKGEFQRASYLDLATGRLETFGPSTSDVEQLVLSPDGRTLAMISNEAGTGVLRLFDANSRRELPRPSMPTGAVKGIEWHHDSGALALVLDTAQTPGDVYVLDRKSNAVARWTESKVEGLDASRFRTQQAIRWTSFDGREITGFITRPPESFNGRRPVIVDGRNLYDPEKMREHGIRYYSIGRVKVEQPAAVRVGESA